MGLLMTITSMLMHGKLVVSATLKESGAGAQAIDQELNIDFESKPVALPSSTLEAVLEPSALCRLYDGPPPVQLVVFALEVVVIHHADIIQSSSGS
jgi:hypothetical protein